MSRPNDSAEVVAVSNRYHDALDEFRCEEVVALKDGDRYTGWVDVWHYTDRSLILLDATGPDDDTLGRTVLDNPDVVYRADPEYEIRAVAPEDVNPCPYSLREFDTRQFYHFVRKLRQRGSLGSFPLVWESKEGLLTLEGHKRLEAARRAGFDSVPVRVTTRLTEWEYMIHWVEDHIPSSDMNLDYGEGKSSGWYTPEKVRDAHELVREDWPDDRLRQLPQFEHLYDDRTPTDEPRPLEVSDGE